MVHKKSEYALKFNIVDNDLRKQIWRDNLKIRELFRATNRADHYWTYQVSDDYLCECESITEEDNGELPPHRLKHKALLAAYKEKKTDKTNGLTWSNDVPIKSGKELEKSQPQVVEKEVGTQTTKDEWKEDDDSSQELRELDKNLSLMSVSGDEQYERDNVTSARPLTPLPVASPPRPLTVNDVVQNYNTPANPKRLTLSASSHKSTAHSLTRTTRKAYFEEKPSPFASYGWNDHVKVVGDKKTYNVQAPQDQVYKQALNTCKRRRAEIQRYLDKEKESRRFFTSPSLNSLINHSSIWRTEYQERFSPNKNALLSAKVQGTPNRQKSAPVTRSTRCRGGQ